MRRGSTSLRPEAIISIVSSPVPGVHMMWSRAQTKGSRKKARKWRKREKFPTYLLPGIPPPPQVFRPTLPYLNALNRLTFQSVMNNRAYFILLIFLAGHMKPTVTTTCQRENCEFFFFLKNYSCSKSVNYTQVQTKSLTTLKKFYWLI